MKMRGCEDEKMFYRPPLLEEPCAQTLSGKMVIFHSYVSLPEGSREGLAGTYLYTIVHLQQNQGFC